jgi:prepilin-type N-terminal cleavage/methylation domain-containing protein
MTAKQRGFTLIEIAIVLVIIGLLLGGVLKGQELIQNARVRNIIAQQDGVKAAYFGFQDRYRGVPGDYPSANAVANIPGVAVAGICPAGTICGTAAGASNGLIDTAQESITAWFHLSRAGFITGNYDGIGVAPTPTNTPTNPYGGFMQLIFDDVYQGVANARNNVKTGSGIPATLLAEVDRKIDDGNANTGEFRFSLFGPAIQACAPVATGLWDINTGQGNCGGASLF